MQDKIGLKVKREKRLGVMPATGPSQIFEVGEAEGGAEVFA